MKRASGAPSMVLAFEKSLLAKGLLSRGVLRAPEKVPSNFAVHAAYRDFLSRAVKALGADAGLIAFCGGTSTRIPCVDFLVSAGYDDVPQERWSDELLLGNPSTVPSDVVLEKPPSRKAILPRSKARLVVPLQTPDDEARVFAILIIESRSRLPDELVAVAEQEREKISHLVFDVEERLLSERLEYTFHIAKQLAHAEQDSARFDRILDAVLALLGPPRGKKRTEVALLQRVGGTLLVRRTRNVLAAPGDVPMVLGTEAGFTAYVGRTRVPFYCTNTADRKAFPQYKPVVDTTLSQYTLPLVFRQDLVGVLNVGTPLVFGFSTMLQRVLGILSSHAAASLHYARLLTDLRTMSGRARDQVRHARGWVAGGNAPVGDGARSIDEVLHRAIQMIDQIVYPLREIAPESVDVPVAVGTVIDAFRERHPDCPLQLHNSLATPLRVEMSQEEFKDVVENALSFAYESTRRHDSRSAGGIDSVPAISIDSAIDSLPSRGARPDRREYRWMRLAFRNETTGLRPPPEGRSLDPQVLYADRSSGETTDGVRLDLALCDRVLAKYGGHLTLLMFGTALEVHVVLPLALQQPATDRDRRE